MVCRAFVFQFSELQALQEAQQHLKHVSSHLDDLREGSLFTFADCTNADLEQKTLRIQVGRIGALDVVDRFQYCLRRYMDPACCTLTLDGEGEAAGLTLKWPLPRIEPCDPC